MPAGADTPYVQSGIDGPYSEVGPSMTTTTVAGKGHIDGEHGVQGGGIGGELFEDVAGETVTVREERESVRAGTLVIAIYAPID